MQQPLCASASVSAQTKYFISTIAGADSIGDNGPATQGLLWQPNDVAVDANSSQ